jgi:hypothetical protein
VANEQVGLFERRPRAVAIRAPTTTATTAGLVGAGVVHQPDAVAVVHLPTADSAARTTQASPGSGLTGTRWLVRWWRTSPRAAVAPQELALVKLPQV